MQIHQDIRDVDRGREAKNANKKKHLELIYGMFVLIFFATKDPHLYDDSCGISQCSGAVEV